MLIILILLIATNALQLVWEYDTLRVLKPVANSLEREREYGVSKNYHNPKQGPVIKALANRSFKFSALRYILCVATIVYAKVYATNALFVFVDSEYNFYEA